jgi:hypothetical protein
MMVNFNRDRVPIEMQLKCHFSMISSFHGHFRHFDRRQRDRVSAKALDRRGRMALHMAETAAEKEAK